MEEEKVLTTEEVRETALKKLQKELENCTDTSGDAKSTEGIAALYREVMNDELSRKKAKWEVRTELLKVGAAGLSAAGTFWAFFRATAKEKEGEIFDTLTKQTVVRNFIANIFRRR